MTHLVAQSVESNERSTLQTIKEEIESDRETLLEMLMSIDAKGSPARNAVAWVAEKAGRLKLLLAGANVGGLGRFEGLEMLAIGIEGKRALWTALLSIESSQLKTKAVDLVALVERAEDQRRRIETLRLAAAKAAFEPSSPSDASRGRSIHRA